MKFIEQHNLLKESFDLSKDEIRIPDSSMVIKNLNFLSHSAIPFDLNGFEHDREIGENIKFRYPVVMPDETGGKKHAIIMLNGLNERNWHKHLSGAKFLAERTGKAVIMFPLSYHINRGLPEWTDVRKMSRLVEVRKQKYANLQLASPVNYALSERLTEHPERFFISGYQSAMDVISLLKEIQNGAHPLFEEDTQTDIFAYSISCMLMQSLMITNPDGVLDRSKIVFFAGGSIFSHIQGMSKFIMDSVAFQSIRKFYFSLMKRNTRMANSSQSCISENKFVQAFKAIIAPEVLKNVREKSIRTFQDQLMVVAMRNDKVIPVPGIREAVGDQFYGSKNFKVVDFSYPYIHENPFPVLYKKIEDQVGNAFQSVYDPISEFYTTGR